MVSRSVKDVPRDEGRFQEMGISSSSFTFIGKRIWVVGPTSTQLLLSLDH